MEDRQSINLRQIEIDEAKREALEEKEFLSEVKDRVRGICGDYVGKVVTNKELDNVSRDLREYFKKVFREPDISMTAKIVKGRLIFDANNKVTNSIILRIYGGK